MSERRAARLALTLSALAFLLAAGTFALLPLTHPPSEAWVILGIQAVMGVSYATIGALIASRRPENPIGWLFCVIGVSFSFWAFREPYVVLGVLTNPGSLPATTLVAWLGSLLAIAAATLVPVVFLLFPTGRVPSRRWRPVAWVLVGGAFLAAAVVAVAPGPLGGFSRENVSVSNPAGIAGLRGLAEGAFGVLAPIVLVALVVSIVALFVRFRSSPAEQRQQLKWLAYAGGADVAILLAALLAAPLAGTDSLASNVLTTTFFIGLVLGIPVAAGLAILRYRLYDIDRIVNRTLVYGLLTGILVGAYVGAVIGLGALARSITEEANNSIVVAVSTLAVAALFRPARGRIQGFIDRRFYRRKYDAARTLEAFATRLREEVDLDTLKTELLGVVRGTMQPAHASLWLAAPSRGAARAVIRNDLGTPGP